MAGLEAIRNIHTGVHQPDTFLSVAIYPLTISHKATETRAFDHEAQEASFLSLSCQHAAG